VNNHDLAMAYKKMGKSLMETGFSDGTVVLADFVENTLTVNGKTLERPPEIPIADIR
jgi:hypothetical protein